MTNYFNSAIDFDDLRNFVLQELHEPVTTGSEAVPLDMVEDKLNATYAEVFNDQRIKPSAREADISFALAEDTTLSAAVAVSATSVGLTESANWQSSGKALLQSDVITYTGNSSDTLTGVTGVNVAHDSGEIARQMYLLTTVASDIVAEQIQYIEVNGIPQTYMPYESLINGIDLNPNCYTVFEGYLIFSRVGTTGSDTPSKVLMVYTQTLTPMSADADVPTLIPNTWRTPILGYGACMKIAASDAYRTSWDWWKSEHEKAVKQYVAFKNNRVRDRSNKLRPSIYKRFVNV